MSELRTIETFALIDLETTGLPAQEFNTTRIVELSILTVSRDDLIYKKYPRVQNKLNLCFNPKKRINPESSCLTGLWNDMLDDQNEFTKNTTGLFVKFLQHLKSPVCLIAHNGNKFDFPILKSEFDKTRAEFNENLLCIDSLIAFRDLLKRKDDVLNETTDNALSTPKKNDESRTPQQIINETTPQRPPSLSTCSILPTKRRLEYNENAIVPLTAPKSYTLSDLYRFLNNKNPTNEHTAEGDVKLLLECILKMGDKFVELADKYAISFKNVPPLGQN